MPLPVISNTVRAACSGVQANGQPYANIWHFRKTSGSIDATALAALATELNKLYGGASYGGGGVNLLNNTPGTTSMNAITFTPLDGSSASTLVAGTAFGSGVTDLLDAQASPIVTLRTGSRGRSFRGRIFLPALHEGSNSSTGTVSSGVITAYNAQLSGFLAALTPINWECVVASYKLSIGTKVTTAVIRSYFGHQVRRRS